MKAPDQPTTKARAKKNRIAKAFLSLAIVVIVLSNTPPAQSFLLPNYSYQNKDGSFLYSEEPGKGMDFEAGQIQFEGWKEQNQNNPNKTLYRTFRIAPWRFWEWWQYFGHYERFTIPYLLVKK